MARTAWDPRRLPDLTGRRYLVTGSTRGLGYFATEQLVRAGAHVILTGRNPNRLAAAHAAIERRVLDAAARGSGAEAAGGGEARHPTSGSLETLLLDTSNFGSIRAAAATARTRGPLHGLLLNAGIVHPPRTRQTVGGHELVFATNVLGHFSLAGELLQNLAVVGGRMVWIGSMSTLLGDHEPVDPELVNDYTPWRAYVQSKVATTVLGLEADRRLREAGVPVASLVAHPGYAISGRTAGVRGVNEPSRMTRFIDNLQAPISQSKEHGAHALVRALADADIEGGQFWGPRYLVHGTPHRTTPAKLLRDPALGTRLWDYCENATRVRWPFEKAARARRRLR
ncbi:SDR family NAD(P)-dependent oxidoreductase [Microbacterium protaetiae]|uniref:SDR family NAD(P)-dependent oxidoreductase n=1 Tax=Microbacterium protaetiae TaxID=2509458 RepID=A0A4V0YD38_9MICO|nr:SDR family NAD(P)-dependent oxidoreductase [Microbacterium protaetiae]QAY59361.1 SDR family NAD(P)-dependent oxidoreductase [Microbacterium protaetiae]